MTFVAIWLGVAVLVGVLLGYAARRLKRAPEARRKSSNSSTDEIKDRESLESSKQFSKKTKKLDA